MSADLTAEEVARVIDQLYRGARPEGDGSQPKSGADCTDALGVPRRFYISRRYEDLKKFIGRKRALRPEFYGQLGSALELDHCILMSQPRRPKAGVLAFASSHVVETWLPVPEPALASVLDKKLQGVWAHAVRARLERLYGLNHGDPARLRPIILSETQLCKVAGKARFKDEWWSDLMDEPATNLIFG